MKNAGTFLFILAVAAFAGYVQSQLPLNYDVSWLMHAAQRMRAGGTYARDFFETNPPLILYLYLPPVILSQLFTGKMIVIFRSYIFLLAALSLALCACLLPKIFTPAQTLLARAFAVTLAVVLLVLPCYEFGQREHLLVIFTMPYFLLMACRLQGKSVHRSVARILGLLAGLGFAIKPHFLLTFLLLEIYYAVYKKNSRAWLRPEALAILGTVAVYTVAIFMFYADYVYIVVPYSLRLYYHAVSQPWSALLLNSVAVYCVLPALLYWAYYKENVCRPLSAVLCIGLLGFWLGYVAQRMTHYYHLIPALSCALLLLVVVLYSLWLSTARRCLAMLGTGLLTLLLAMVPLWIFDQLYANALRYKKEMLGPLTAFINTNVQQDPIYFFVTAGDVAFPSVDYTHATVVPRFSFLWMAAGLANQALQPAPSAAWQRNRDRNFLSNMIADDLHQYRPRFIFVDQQRHKYRIQDHHFDYVAYFSEYPKFKQEWKNYHYLTTLEQPGYYKLGVYQRER